MKVLFVKSWEYPNKDLYALARGWVK